MISYLVAVALCCASGAAQPMEASFCDMWPLAVGNKWVSNLEGIVGGTSTTEIVGQETRNGCAVWHMLFTVTGANPVPPTDTYLVFVGGWCYYTQDQAALDSLPAIPAPCMVLPAVFREGQTFPAWIGLPGEVPTATVVFRSADVVDVASGNMVYWRFIRGQGLDESGGGGASYTSATIVGTCSGPPPVQVLISPSQWVEVGQTLRLTVPESSGSGFQWYKNGAPIQDATTSAYVIAAAELEDSGSYRCRISDAPKASYDTRTVTVTVFSEGSLPVAGTAGLAVLALVLAAMSCARIQKSVRR